MGITGLLPFLKKCSKQSNIKEYSGCTVAIDAYCWLHKGAFSCAEKLVMNEQTTMYVTYCMKYVNMLLSHNIKPILVFDGQNLPAKAMTEEKRRHNRDINRRKGLDLIRAGRVPEGRNVLRRSLDVTHEMALEVMKECHRRNVDCIVAPYEADAQLAYLNLQGIADVIITEDSDLMLFGCKTVMFKMDVNGNGIIVESSQLHLAMGVSPENYSLDKFRLMCILSGCDYLESLQGIGLSKACKFVTRTSETDIYKALSKLAANLNMWNLEVTDEYRSGVVAADLTFRCQLVFDPRQRRQVPLTLPRDGEGAVGERKEDAVAFQMALGNVHPRHLATIHHFNPDTYYKKAVSRSEASLRAPHASIWSSNFSRPFVKQRVVPCIFRNATGGKIVKAEVSNFKPKTNNEDEEKLDDGIDLLEMYGGKKRRRNTSESESYQCSRYFNKSTEEISKSQSQNNDQSCLDGLDEDLPKVECKISGEDDLFAEQHSSASLSCSFVGRTELLTMAESTDSEMSSSGGSVDNCLTKREDIKSENTQRSPEVVRSENTQRSPEVVRSENTQRSPEVVRRSALQAFRFKPSSNSPRASALSLFNFKSTKLNGKTEENVVKPKEKIQNVEWTSKGKAEENPIRPKKTNQNIEETSGLKICVSTQSSLQESQEENLMSSCEVVMDGEDIDTNFEERVENGANTTTVKDEDVLNSICYDKTDVERPCGTVSPELATKSPLQAFRFRQNNAAPRSMGQSSLNTVGTSTSVFFGGSSLTPQPKSTAGKLRTGLSRKKPLPPQQSVLAKFGFQVRPKLT